MDDRSPTYGSKLAAYHADELCRFIRGLHATHTTRGWRITGSHSRHTFLTTEWHDGPGWLVILTSNDGKHVASVPDDPDNPVHPVYEMWVRLAYDNPNQAPARPLWK